MMKKSKAERELEKKAARRPHELATVKRLEKNIMNLYSPVQPKKPDEFKFDSEDVKSFEYPIEIGNTVIEKKSDGNCVHVIIDQKAKAGEKIRIYSSQLNPWNTACFPDVIPELLKQPSGYYHGELLGLKPKGVESFRALDEFIAVSRRPKLSTKDVTPDLVRQYPLKLDIFDVLRFEKKPMLSKPLEARRELLEKIISQDNHVNLIQQWNANSKESLQKLFLKAMGNGYEGLIAKDPASLYIPGSRDSDWIKLKEFTTLDLAVLGLYETSESKSAGKPFSAILVGTYNEKTRRFETVGKIKVGALADQKELYSQLPKLVKTGGDYRKVVKASPMTTINPTMESIKRKIPDYVVRYSSDNNIAVVEVKILDVTYSDNWHSCGIGYDGEQAHSLRLPTYKQLRSDKTRLSDVTTTKQVHSFYIG
jgi:DNA ligase 1